MKKRLPYPGSGRAHGKNILIHGKARFTVLSAGLLRLEYAEDGHFEDRASYFAVKRDQEPQIFESKSGAAGLEIETAQFQLRYRGGPFDAASLNISLKGQAGSWRPGVEDSENLGGTFRTLDEVGSARELGQGILSRSGWTLVDDSKSILFSDDEEAWAESRPKTQHIDWYFFAYGHDYRAALANFVSVSGPAPLPPRFAFGSWYSRYWPYRSEDFLALAKDYRTHDFPLDVMVIDMDWHRKGWTGYSWNAELIPDPKVLLETLHAQGLKLTLNLHPHEGVGPHEDAYAAFCKAMGLEAKGETVPFDISDRRFAKAYFEVLLHPLEELGIDFWWMDWQQGTQTKIDGLDPLTWLNYLHFIDRERESNREKGSSSKAPKRGMNFSRWGGLGDQRYPIHFSGDTHANWEVLEFLAPFTATAGNVGVTYWSHDIGGHFATIPNTNPELLTRWVQFGALSPVLRVHSSRDKGNDRRPWMFGEPFTSAMRKAYQLRSELLPYIYTAARAAYDSGLPLLRPMYLHYPKLDAAYQYPQQYFVGEDLLMAPLSRPGFGPARLSHLCVWIPEGDWILQSSGERFQGPKELVLALALDEVALLVRAGAPIPLDSGVLLYPGEACQRELYEDDGQSIAYRQDECRRTRLESRNQKGELLLEIGPSQGTFPAGPGKRALGSIQAPENSFEAIALPSIDTKGSQSIRLGKILDSEAREAYQWLCREQRLARNLAWQLELSLAEKEVALTLERDSKALKKSILESGLNEDLKLALKELREAKEVLNERILKESDSKFEAAQRLLAGFSIHVNMRASENALQRILEIEILRENPVEGELELELRCPDEAPKDMKRQLGLGHRELIRLELKTNHRQLRQEIAKLDLHLEAGGHRLHFRESLIWRANTIRDWFILGPLEIGKGPGPESFSKEIVTKIVYPGSNGVAAQWRRQRFDPVGVMRGIREIYDFGEILYCPEGEIFAASYVSCEEAGLYRIGLGHEGKATLWINGEELGPKEGKFEAQLKSGRNLIVLRLRHLRRKGGGFGLSLEPEGRPLEVPDPATLHPDLA